MQCVEIKCIVRHVVYIYIYSFTLDGFLCRHIFVEPCYHPRVAICAVGGIVQSMAFFGVHAEGCGHPLASKMRCATKEFDTGHMSSSSP